MEGQIPKPMKAKKTRRKSENGQTLPITSTEIKPSEVVSCQPLYATLSTASVCPTIASF